MPNYADMTTAELIALEERMYDDALDGDDNWFERDQVLWELNRRGIMKREAFGASVTI